MLGEVRAEIRRSLPHGLTNCLALRTATFDPGTTCSFTTTPLASLLRPRANSLVAAVDLHAAAALVAPSRAGPAALFFTTFLGNVWRGSAWLTCSAMSSTPLP